MRPSADQPLEKDSKPPFLPGTASPATFSAAEEVELGEEELWWGGYSPWEALPSLLAGMVLTGLLAWGTWLFLPVPWTRLVFRSGAGALWFLLLGRLLWRFLGTSYRLTNRRLFVEHGLFFLNRRRAVPLDAITAIVPRQHFWERGWRGGRLCLRLADGSQLVLTGLRQPQEVAEFFQKAILNLKKEPTAYSGRSS